jgi:hypothetical protein
MLRSKYEYERVKIYILFQMHRSNTEKVMNVSEHKYEHIQFTEYNVIISIIIQKFFCFSKNIVIFRILYCFQGNANYTSLHVRNH